MAKSPVILLWKVLYPILWHITILQFPAKISGIRKDVGFQVKPMCRNTVQGRYLISDDNGNVCDALSLDSWSRCCPEKGKRFSCQGCNLVSQCCNSYEFCVSCCLNPARTQKELALKVKIAKPVTAGTYATIFDFCAGRCRHNSASVVHENAYASDFHHCFSLLSNSSGATDTNSEARLSGINVVIGSQGESCNSACKGKGQSCVPNKLFVLNNCELLQKYMNCKGACLASMGADQPAEVVDDAPKHLNPGACLYTRVQAMASCDGSHQYTRRLCPCA
ncbi:glycosyltransferase family protein isoform X2 [Tasmannia lanceolata]|uniref:glycosyltransferase family protein isoform X2 n=1 Tax=Tasmannia lanceolata TaxID=3420 RepID=UPI00406403E6